MHVLSSAAGSAWDFGGSIMSFLFPMVLFVLVASGLYVLYTKPGLVPGHWVRGAERPVSYTAIPRLPVAAAAAGPAHDDAAGPAHDAGGAAARGGQAADTEDAE